MSKITHEYIRNHFKNNFNANDVRYEDLRIITEYVSQQEKQEKLLELYQQFYKILNKGGRTVADIETCRNDG